MKKILALILASLLMAFALVGCTKTAEEAGESKNDTETSDTNANTDPTSGTLSFDELTSQIEALVGKTENDNKTIMTVNGYNVSYAEYRYNYMNYLKQLAYYYGYDFLDDEESKEMFDKYVDDGTKMAGIVVTTANERGLGLTQEEFDTNVIDDVYNYLVESYGDDLESIFEDQYSTSVYNLLSTEVAYNLYNKLYENIYGVGTEKYEEIKAQTLEYYNDNDYVRVKHILVQFPTNEDGSDVTDEQKAEALATATEVLERAKAGEDFDALTAEYNEDPGVNSNPYGYYFGKDQMVKEFEDASYSLAEGEMVDEPVETTYGYHIILRLPIDDDDIYYTSEFQDNAYTDFDETVGEMLENTEVVKAEGFDEMEAAIIKEGTDYLESMKAEEEAANAAQEEAEG